MDRTDVIFDFGGVGAKAVGIYTVTLAAVLTGAIWVLTFMEVQRMVGGRHTSMNR
jgi:hypothetical protein